MSALPHVPDPKQAGRALDLVLKGTTPSTVGVAHLEANGFPAPTGEQVWAFLHGLGLLDADGSPTDLWARYKDADDPATVLSDIVHDVYGPLLPAGADGIGADGEHSDPVAATFTALCRRAGIALGAPAAPAPVRPRREVLRDLSDLLQRSVDEFEQARRCLANDLPRPAHVAAWNSFVALAFAQLSGDDFARLRTSGRRASLPVDDLVRMVPGSELIRLLIEHSLVPADEKDTYDELLRQRNDCVQPTSVSPDRGTTAAYLSAVLGISAQITDAGAATLPAAPSTPPPPTTPR